MMVKIRVNSPRTCKKHYRNLYKYEIIDEKIKYPQYYWKNYAILKSVAILTGFQIGYTKFCLLFFMRMG